MIPLTTNFKIEEVECNCGCGYAVVHDILIKSLQAARTIAGLPFPITSWCRCETYNETIDGAPHSPHCLCMAVDILCSNPADRYRIVNALMAAEFMVIRIYEKHIHASMLPIGETPIIAYGTYRTDDDK